MSIKLMTAAWDMDIPSTEKMVLLCLCDYADENGKSCYPSIATLAKRTSKNARTVQRALRWLEKSKICDSHERAGTSTNYTLNLDAFVRGDKMSGVTKTTPRGDTTPPNPPRTTIVDKAKALPIVKSKSAKHFPKPEGVEQSIWNDYLDLRKAKRAPLSNTALTAIEREAARAGWSLNDALAECVARGWQSFKAAWVRENGQSRNQQGGMGVTERAAHRALSEITGGTGNFAGRGGQIPPADAGRGHRTIDAVPDTVRAIGYAGG
ncbi:MAG: helix-turn-helix domain-containing protein [Pseudomonadota bacterium]